jgi:hypothetical protein
MATSEIRSPTPENNATETKRSRSSRFAALSDERDDGEIDSGTRKAFGIVERSNRQIQLFRPKKESFQLRRRFNTGRETAEIRPSEEETGWRNPVAKSQANALKGQRPAADTWFVTRAGAGG